ncbi:hypothetical protein [Pontibacter sp. H249]|uniref:hypothetical protein n=1 Tax=Pontibacter sp. H249 TaxID=3133420 RepID=UPI0030BD20F2
MKKYIFSLAVLVVAVAAVAFTNPAEPTPVEETAATLYRFTGNQLSQANDPEHWAVVQDPEEVEGCEEGTLPCSVMINTSIETWLSGKTPEDAADDADTRRN